MRFGSALALALSALAAAGQVRAADPPSRVTVTAAKPKPGPAASKKTDDSGIIEITSDVDLEWLQQDKAYIARGNAVAKRGTVVLTGDTLIAYYRNRADRPVGAQPRGPQPAANGGNGPGGNGQGGLDTGDTDIWRVAAEGHVHVSSEGRDAYGDRMDYDKDRGVIVLTGRELKAKTPTESMTARDALEYWQDRNIGVARGDAVITNASGETLGADVIGAQFEKDSAGDSSLKTIQADGHVTITTATDIVHGDVGAYDLVARRAVVSGNVRVTRGQSELEGESAEVNMDTGISQVFSGAGKRVRALLVPEKNQQPAPQTGQRP